MGMLKRRLKQEEEGDDDYVGDNDVSASELSDDSSTASPSSEEEEELQQPRGNSESRGKATTGPTDGSTPRPKVMVLSSRGVNARQRHLMDDLCLLLPHAKRESKFDTKRHLFALNELAELQECNHILFFESRKPQELFIWAAKSPSGPSVRFHVENIHTLEELHLTGNCMKNARPVLTFDPAFGRSAHGQVMRELLEVTFGVPQQHRKTRPYVDRVMHFAWGDDRIWVRNYQIKEGVVEEGSVEGLKLEEIGPRFLLHPVRVMEGSFSGRVLWSNPNYVPASALRANARLQLALRRQQRSVDAEAAQLRRQELIPADNELDHVFD